MAREDLSYVNLTDFDAYLVAELYDCPVGLRNQVLKQQLIYFQTQSQAWRCELYPMNIVQGKQIYDLEDIPDYAMVEVPYWVEKEGTEIFPESGYTMWTRNELKLKVAPGAAKSQGLKVGVVLKNTATATQTDLRLFEDWRDTIAHGVFWKLMSMKGKTWSDPGLATYHEFHFWQGIADARADINRKQMNETLISAQGGFI